MIHCQLKLRCRGFPLIIAHLQLQKTAQNILTTMHTIETHCLLKGAPHEGTDILTVDAMPRDSHEVAPARHDVTEQGKVTVVHIGAVK